MESLEDNVSMELTNMMSNVTCAIIHKRSEHYAGDNIQLTIDGIINEECTAMYYNISIDLV